MKIKIAKAKTIKTKTIKTKTIYMSIFLVFLITAQTLAAVPQATYDETLYINLDHYGTTTKTSIVKSYSLNGNTQITDYGNYDDVINMTDYTPFEKYEQNVVFDFSKSASLPKRFYFEGKEPELISVLPWDFDVSYKLNGVPSKAEAILGKSGLIEININVKPNENAIEYYKNNLILEASCIVDTDDILSVSAPGSQIITLGSLKTIMFFALPGEEGNFTIQIGSEDFEFNGIIFTIHPATMSQTEKINDLRDAKNDVEDSADAISDSLDIILDTLNGMQDSFYNTSEGLNKINIARETIQNSKGALYTEADSALNAMGELSESLEKYNGHFDTAINAVNDINRDLNTVNDSIQYFTSTLEDIKEVSENIKTDIDAIDELLTTADEDSEKWNKTLESLSSNLDKLSKNKDSLNAYLKGLSSASKNLATSLDTLSSDGNVRYISDNLMNSFGEGDVNSGGIWAVLYSIQYLSSDLSALSNNVGNICGLIADYDNKPNNFDITQLSADLSDLSKLSQNIINNIYSHSDDFHNILSNSSELTNIISDASQKSQTTLESINKTVDTANKYKSELEKLISDSKTTVEKTNNSVITLKNFMSKLKDMLQNAGEDFNSGTDETLNGVIDSLLQSITALSQTDVIKNSKDTIKELAEQKWDEYTGEDNNALNIDSSLPPLSFTSAQNESPQNIQIILRTDEIKHNDDTEAPDINEDIEASGTIFTRIISVFKKLFNSIISLFK